MLSETFKPDMVLMDATMPGMNGIEVTRRIVLQPDAPRIVMLSLHDNDEYQRHAQAAGAEVFLAKSQFPDCRRSCADCSVPSAGTRQ